MASTTAVSPTTLWAGPRRGPVFELRDFFGGARERCDFHVEHYAHQHVTKNRFILVDAPLHYDQSVIEVALGNGFTAFQLLFHMGVTPMAHVWEDLYNKLSNPPTAIEDMDPDSLAQFLGVVLTQGQDKDEILTQFVRRECDAHGYRVPEVPPFDHEFRAFKLEPPRCSEAACHTCRPPRGECDCMACSSTRCICPGCSAERKAYYASKYQPCAMCEEKGKGWDEDCPNCNELSPPSTPGADLKSIDTEEEYLEFMEDREREFWEPRRAERELWLKSRRAEHQP